MVTVRNRASPPSLRHVEHLARARPTEGTPTAQPAQRRKAVVQGSQIAKDGTPDKSLEVEVCERAAQAMRACAADVGLTHPYWTQFSRLATDFQQHARRMGSDPGPVPAAATVDPRRLRLVH